MTVPYDIINDVLKVLQTIQQGNVPTVACDMMGMSYSTFCTYTKADGQYPQLASMRKEAEDRLYDQMAEALPHIYDHPIYGTADPKMAGVVSSNIKWLLERRRRSDFGPQSTIEHKLTADKEVLDALYQARARAQGLEQPRLTTVATDVLDLAVVSGEETDDVDLAHDEEAYLRELAEIS